MDGTQDCTIYRPTKGAVTAAGGQIDTWGAATVSNVPALIEKLTVGRALRIFGIDSNARYRGLVDKGVDVQKEDVIKVVAGELLNTYMRVLGVDPVIDSDDMLLEMADTNEVPA